MNWPRVSDNNSVVVGSFELQVGYDHVIHTNCHSLIKTCCGYIAELLCCSSRI